MNVRSDGDWDFRGDIVCYLQHANHAVFAVLTGYGEYYRIGVEDNKDEPYLDKIGIQRADEACPAERTGATWGYGYPLGWEVKRGNLTVHEED